MYQKYSVGLIGFCLTQITDVVVKKQQIEELFLFNICYFFFKLAKKMHFKEDNIKNTL